MDVLGGEILLQLIILSCYSMLLHPLVNVGVTGPDMIYRQCEHVLYSQRSSDEGLQVIRCVQDQTNLNDWNSHTPELQT